MRRLQTVKRIIAFAGVSLFISGCHTPKAEVDKGPRFREDAFVDVVVCFYGWDNIFITRPEFRDRGFQRPLSRDDLEDTFKGLHVQHDMAVVLMNWNYNASQTARNIESWRTILAGCGFQRVVCLRALDKKKLNGLRIIDDWTRPAGEPERSTGL